MRGTERGDVGQERCFAAYRFDVSVVVKAVQRAGRVVLMELLIVMFCEWRVRKHQAFLRRHLLVESIEALQ
jgi:uncharacterized protein YgbK (DUF1537 family)